MLTLLSGGILMVMIHDSLSVEINVDKKGILK